MCAKTVSKVAEDDEIILIMDDYVIFDDTIRSFPDASKSTWQDCDMLLNAGIAL